MVGNDHDHAVDDGEMVVHNDPDGADEVVEEEDKNIHCSPDDDLVDKMPANAAVVDDDYDTLTVEGDLTTTIVWFRWILLKMMRLLMKMTRRTVHVHRGTSLIMVFTTGSTWDIHAILWHGLPFHFDYVLCFISVCS